MNQQIKILKHVSQDPVCGTVVDEAIALHDERDGKAFCLCNYFCRQPFLAASSGANLVEEFEGSHA